MQVEQVMTHAVHTCQPVDSLRRAAQLMWQNDFGSIPVCVDDGEARVIGMITDRDICMCALFHGKCLSDLNRG